MNFSMVPSNGNGRLWRLSGRPCRRTLFISLCFCAAYGLFHFVAKENFSSSNPSSSYEDDLTINFRAMNRLSLTAPSTLFLGSPSSSVAVAPAAVPASSSSGSLDPSSSVGIPNLFGLTLASSTSTSTTTTLRTQWSDEEPLVDKGTMTIEDLILEAAGSIRNIPLPPYILSKNKDGPKYFRNSSCARFPTIYDLEFSNTFWQVWNYVISHRMKLADKY